MSTRSCPLGPAGVYTPIRVCTRERPRRSELQREEKSRRLTRRRRRPPPPAPRVHPRRAFSLLSSYGPSKTRTGSQWIPRELRRATARPTESRERSHGRSLGSRCLHSSGFPKPGYYNSILPNAPNEISDARPRVSPSTLPGGTTARQGIRDYSLFLPSFSFLFSLHACAAVADFWDCRGREPVRLDQP